MPASAARGDALSQNAHAAQTDMAGTADDDVVVDGDAQFLGRIGDLAGHVDVGPRRRRVAARMIVQHTTNFGIYLEIKTKYENFR